MFFRVGSREKFRNLTLIKFFWFNKIRIKSGKLVNKLGIIVFEYNLGWKVDKFDVGKLEKY
jgi:hypothetical protein